jgi:hypothetical protein
MNIPDGTRVRARRTGWDGSLLETAVDGAYIPSDWDTSEFAFEIEDEDIIPVEPVEGVLKSRYVTSLGYRQHLVITDAGSVIVVDPAKIEVVNDT